MIEMMIIAAIVSSVTLRVAGNVAVDGFFAARGQESPRYTRAKARRTPGAASRYWSEVWDDAWTNASKKRADKKAGRSSSSRPRGAATQFFAGLAQDGRRAAGRRWDEGWTRADEKRREKATRPRPGQQTVPGTVVPNAEDGSHYGNCDRCGKRMLLLRDQTTCAHCEYEVANPHHDGPLTQAELDWARWAAGPEDDPRTDEQIEADIVKEHGSRQSYRIWGQPKHLDPDPQSGPDSPSQDGDGDRPEDRPRPEPRLVQDGDGRTDLRFGEDEDDPTGVSSCPECHGTGINQDGGICESCRDRQEQRNQHYEQQERDDMTIVTDDPRDAWQVRLPNGHAVITNDPENYQSAGYPVQRVSGYDRPGGFDVTGYPTQEGTTMTTTMTTTMPTDTEVVSLSKAIHYSESTARVAAEMVNNIDFTQANLAAGGVTGIAVDAFASAKENFGSIAAAMTSAAAEFKAQLAIQEAYNANPGAGSKEFIMGGR